jgi:hypothetical protein
MNEKYLQDWYNILLKSLEEFITLVSGFLPKLIGALLLYILGRIIAKIVKKVVIKAIQITKLNVLITKTKINDYFEKAGLTANFEEFIGSMVYWAVFLVFLMSASEVIGIQIISTTIAELVNYLPNVIAAIIIILITTFIARFVKDIVVKSLEQVNLGSSSIIGSSTFILIMLFGLTIALSQLGLDVTIITTNITLILGGIMVACVLTFTYGSHRAVTNLIAGYYVKKQFKAKDDIVVSGLTGKIKELNSINLILTSDNKDMMIPYTKILKDGSL